MSKIKDSKHTNVAICRGTAVASVLRSRDRGLEEVIRRRDRPAETELITSFIVGEQEMPR